MKNGQKTNMFHIKDVQDPAVTVTFPLNEDPNVNMVAWTTTPWTLPSNLALCVHPELIYVKIQVIFYIIEFKTIFDILNIILSIQ